MTSEIGVPVVVLPGAWSRVDLSSDEAARASTKRIAEKAVGKGDAGARLRAELRERILSAVSPAREKGAVEFHFAQELTTGVPLSASLAVFVVRADLAELDSLGGADMSRLVSESVKDGSTDTAIDAGSLGVVRRTYKRKYVESDAPELPILQADYWVTGVRPARVAILSFSTAFVEFEEQMLELFDAILKTIRWDAAL